MPMSPAVLEPVLSATIQAELAAAFPASAADAAQLAQQVLMADAFAAAIAGEVIDHITTFAEVAGGGIDTNGDTLVTNKIT